MLHHPKNMPLGPQPLGSSYHSLGNSRTSVLNAVLRSGLPYSRKLAGHSSCVNALAFSSGEGRFLASGGDDMQVRIWDFHQEDITAPSWSFGGPRGNIFSLSFSATNRYLYSGGTDETVLKYDIAQLGSRLDVTSNWSPDQRFTEHGDTIRGISCHPYQDHIFLSASQDGRILHHDGRVSSRTVRAQDILQLEAEITGVQFHPVMEHLFVTSDGRGSVCLRDVRMAFGPLKNRTRHGVVHSYITKLTKGGSNVCNPEASSVTFDREGDKLAVTMLQYLPTIYALSDPNPIAVCDAKNRPDGTPIPQTERTYANFCTIKHGSFGGPGFDTDGFYSAGSEDFCGYLWKIPRVSELTELRREVHPDNWITESEPDTIGYTEKRGDPIHIPVKLDTPFCRLTGHNSIVNSTLIHPHLLHVVTSGIEKDILLHSPTPNSPCARNMELTRTDVRRLGDPDAEDRLLYLDAFASIFRPEAVPDEENSNSERMTIAMFDHILLQESDVNLFEARRWRADSSDEEGENSQDSNGIIS